MMLKSYHYLRSFHNKLFQNVFLQGFSTEKFKYGTQIAQYLNIQIPKINQDLQIDPDQKCWLIGYRKIVNQMQQQQHQQNTDEKIKYIKDVGNRQEIKFSQIQKIASQQNLDIYCHDQTCNEIGLSNICQRIYRKYYFTNIYKKKSTAKKYKQIRISETIHKNDLSNLAKKIKDMVSKGSYKFKIITQNQSDKCEQNINKLCQLVGKQGAMIKLNEDTLRQKSGRMKKIAVQRFTVHLDFQEQVLIDYQKVNKKWKRKIILENLTQKKSNQSISMDTLINMPLQAQKQILLALRKSKKPLPKAYKDYQESQNSLEGGLKSFFNLQIDKTLQKQRQIQEDEDIDAQQDSEQQIDQYTQQNMKRVLGDRKVQDILDDMEQIKKGKVQLNQIELSQIRKLQSQLKDVLKLGGYGKQL